MAIYDDFFIENSDDPIIKEKKSERKPVSKEDFFEITKIVIDNLEGGYFHPKQIRDGRVKDKSGIMAGIDPKTGQKIPGVSPSGETMMGIDRVNGAGYRSGNPEAWDKLFGTLDKANASDKWAYNSFSYPGDPNEKKQKLFFQSLVSDIIYAYFIKYTNLYIKSDEAYNLLKSSPEIIFHFSYGVWNGPGWFKSFARDFEKQVNNGVKDPVALANYVANFRATHSNPIIRATGIKIKNNVFPKLRNQVTFSKTPTEIDKEIKNTAVKKQNIQTETKMSLDINKSEIKNKADDKIIKNSLIKNEPESSLIAAENPVKTENKSLLEKISNQIPKATLEELFSTPSGKLTYEVLLKTYPSFKYAKVFINAFKKLPPYIVFP